MKTLFHGSKTPGISALEPRSLLHGTDRRVVYLTGNMPFALLYIWDGVRTRYEKKYVSGWVRGGTAFYEEQFPDQLGAFYRGVSGYIYLVNPSEHILPVENREDMFYCEGIVPTVDSVYIPDANEEILKYERLGKLVILRFRDQPVERQRQLTDMIASDILSSGFFQNDPAQAEFMRKYHIAAWERAEKM